MASGFVTGDGSLIGVSGTRPTITRTGPGVYSFDINLGGGGCPLISLTSYGHSKTVYWYGGGCGGGWFGTNVHVEGGEDASWSYLIVGFDSTAEASALGEEAIEFTTAD